MPSHAHSNLQLVHTWIYMTQLARRLIQHFKSMAISHSWSEWPLSAPAQIVTVNWLILASLRYISKLFEYWVDWVQATGLFTRLIKNTDDSEYRHIVTLYFIKTFQLSLYHQSYRALVFTKYNLSVLNFIKRIENVTQIIQFTGEKKKAVSLGGKNISLGQKKKIVMLPSPDRP